MNIKVRKIIISFIVLAVGIGLTVYFSPGKTIGEGEITLIIRDLDETLVYDEKLEFLEDETLYDVLNSKFEIVETNGLLEEVKGEDFHLKAYYNVDYTSFMIYHLVNNEEVMTNYGMKQLPLSDGETYFLVIHYFGND